MGLRFLKDVKMIWKEKEISILGSLTYRYREIVCSLLSSRRHSWPFAEQGVFIY